MFDLSDGIRQDPDPAEPPGGGSRSDPSTATPVGPMGDDNLEAGPVPPGESPGPKAGGRRLLPRLVLGTSIAAVLIVLVALLGKEAFPYLRWFAEWVEGLGFWAPVAYIAGYTILTVAMVPGSPLTIAAGAIFGLAWGTAYALIGATTGACAAFLISRYVARGTIERRLEGNARFAAVDRAIADRGFFIVVLLRLSPVFPFNLINYGLGLTKVPFPHYAAASIAMLPGSLLYVYIGFAAGSVAAALSGEAERDWGPSDIVLLVLGLLATILVTAWVTRLARRALKEATGDGDPAHPPARSA